MKKIICFIMIIFLQFSLVSCEKSAQNDENVKNLFSNYNEQIEETEIHKSETQIYYKENKYVSFEITNDFSVNFNNDDIVFFDDGTAMAKLYSYITIKPADTNFHKNYDGIYINAQNNKILREINTGSKTLSLEEINLESFKIVNAMKITPLFESYKNIGVAIYFPNNQEDEINYDEIKIRNSDGVFTSNTGTIYYTCLKDIYNLNGLSKNDFNTSIQFEFQLDTINNLNTISIDMDINFENKFITLNIIKVGENDFYYLPMQENNMQFSINNGDNINLINFILK